jgi:hypothetical protein
MSPGAQLFPAHATGSVETASKTAPTLFIAENAGKTAVS